MIGERDRATELYEERYREWGAFADQVELATIPRAGHYFLKHQAETLAAADRGAPGPLGRRRPARAGGAVARGPERRRSLRRFYTVAAGQTVSRSAPR